MKNFHRPYPMFALCGLNCGLCQMYIGNYCPGCGGGQGNQSCAVARCSMEHDNCEYCVQCPEYPCGRYKEEDAYDIFISKRNKNQDLQKMVRIGIEAYRAELERKLELLELLLSRYNDGRRKNFFCTAVNLLEVSDVEEVLKEVQKAEASLTQKERSKLAVDLFQKKAGERQIDLKLRKKKKN